MSTGVALKIQTFLLWLQHGLGIVDNTPNALAAWVKNAPWATQLHVQVRGTTAV